MFIDFLTKYIVLLQNLVNEIRKCNPFPSEHVSIWYLFFEPHQTTHQSILGVRLRKVTELHPTYLIFANCVLFYFASGLGRASIFFDLLWFVCRFKCAGHVLLYLGMRVHVVICVQVPSDVCLHLIIISFFCNLVVGCWQWIMQSCSKWGYGVCREACKGGSGSERVGLLSSDPIVAAEGTAKDAEFLVQEGASILVRDRLVPDLILLFWVFLLMKHLCYGKVFHVSAQLFWNIK